LEQAELCPADCLPNHYSRSWTVRGAESKPTFISTCPRSRSLPSPSDRPLAAHAQKKKKTAISRNILKTLIIPHFL